MASDDELALEKVFRCARCAQPICSPEDRIEIDGLHEHSQINPHGYIWNFGCFAQAPGCLAQGPTTSEFSWFLGHTWQLQACRGCGLHLGWHFTGTQRSFYGLILERLVLDQAP